MPVKDLAPNPITPKIPSAPPKAKAVRSSFAEFASKHKKTIIWTCVSLAIAGVMIFLSYRFIIGGESIDFKGSLIGVGGKRLWILAILALMVIRSVAYGVGAWFYLRRYSFDKKVQWWKFLPLAMQMTFIQVITPFTIGSQPWAIFYLKRKGYRLREVVPAIMARDTYHQLALVLVPLTYSPKAIHDSFVALGVNSVFATLLAAGMFVDFIGAAIVFGAGASGRFQRFVLRIVHWLREKIFHTPRLESKVNEWIEKQRTFQRNYVDNLKDANANFYVCILMLVNIFCIGFMFHMSAEYATDRNINFYSSSALAAASYSASGIVPIPGGIGEQEYLLKISTGWAFYSGSTPAAHAADAVAQNTTISAWRFWSSFVPGGIGLLFMIVGVPLLIWKNKKWVNLGLSKEAKAKAG